MCRCLSYCDDFVYVPFMLAYEGIPRFVLYSDSLLVLLCLAYIRGGIFWPTYIRRSDVPVSVESGRYSCAIGRPVGRPRPDTESRLSVRSTARSTGAFPESRALWTVDLVGRPAICQVKACTSVHVGRSPGRLTSEPGRPLKPENSSKIGIKTWLF